MKLSHTIADMLLEGKVTAKQCIAVLEKHNQLFLLPTIVKLLTHNAKTNALYDTVCIETPFPVSQAGVATIKRVVGNDLAPHESVINKELLAGFRARYKGKLYDASALRIVEQLI